MLQYLAAILGTDPDASTLKRRVFAEKLQIKSKDLFHLEDVDIDREINKNRRK